MPGADYPKSASTAYAAPQLTDLGRLAAEAAQGHDGSSGYRLLSAGADGLLARLQLAERAERALDL